MKLQHAAQELNLHSPLELKLPGETQKGVEYLDYVEEVLNVAKRHLEICS